MSNCRSWRLPSAKAISVVESVKELTNELKAAISRDELMNKFCFRGVITDRAKNVQYMEEKYSKAAEELKNLTDQLESSKKRLDDVTIQYENLLDENRTLENTIHSIKTGDYLCNNERKGFNSSRLKLRLYKRMTGVYFDLNNSNEELSGFIAVKGDTKQPSGLIPFAFNKEEDISLFLWEKIGEALHKENENLLDSATTQVQEKLEIK